MSIYKNGIWVQSSINERLLPEGYTQIEYLESTGTQWIDSNVITSEKISYEAEGSIIEQTDTSDAAFCGTRDTGNNNTRFITWWNDYTVTGGRINQSYYTNGDSADYVTEYAKKYKISMKNKVFSINDTVQKVFTGTITNPNNLTFALIALKYNATTTDSRRFKGRIYYFKIWNENILVRDFIPAIRNTDQKPGMYDVVNNIFYINMGTNEFISGSQIGGTSTNAKIYKDDNSIEANNFIEI